MPTHSSVAKSVRMAKESRPENYCPVPRCLWRTGGGYCPRHAPAASSSGENRETRMPLVNGRPLIDASREG